MWEAAPLAEMTALWWAVISRRRKESLIAGPFCAYAQATEFLNQDSVCKLLVDDTFEVQVLETADVKLYVRDNYLRWTFMTPTVT